VKVRSRSGACDQFNVGLCQSVPVLLHEARPYRYATNPALPKCRCAVALFVAAPVWTLQRYAPACRS
jgi:hypothetical protein